MIKIQTLLDNLRIIPKTYFSYKDLFNLYNGKGKVLKVLLSRLVRKKRIIRLIRGFYSLSSIDIDYEALSCEMVNPSYISFEYALWKYGIINEIPANISLATTKKTCNRVIQNTFFEYSHINSNLFFGYKIENNYLIAEKEKALLDEIYLVSLRKRNFNLNKIDFKSIKISLFKKWSRKYPGYTQQLVKKIMEAHG